MATRQRPRTTNRIARGRVLKPTKSRQKLDPRLAVLLSLGARPLAALKTQEAAQLSEVAKLLREAQAALDAEGDAQTAKSVEAMQRAEQRLFAPITTGVHYPPARGQGKPWPVKIDQPYAAVFILSDGSAADLARLGVKVRSQAGDVFTGFVPLASMAKLEQSAAVRYIELARPVFPTLNQAVPYAQINTLHGAAPPITGAGVIVGISDSVLDVYHPDFRTAANTSRVLFLWDQTLTPIAGEAGPPTAPALPGFAPAGGATYGVEYNQATINNELAAYAPPGTPAYGIVRHGGTTGEHGTHVAGIAAGNGRGQAGTFTGAAPGADIIFVANPGLQNTNVLADLAFVADAFSYIFARAAARGQPCVVNLSNSDNQGPHDGSTLGEQFLDNLLLTPGRAITVSAGNSNNTACHAAGNVAASGTTNLVLNYAAGIHRSDAVEIWYDGHDRFNITLTIPTAPATVIGPVAPGAAAGAVLPNGVQVQVTSVQGDPRNGDNLISVIMTVPAGQNLPIGNWTFALAGTTVINGAFHAWVDRNNRGLSAWQAPLLQEGQTTLGVPATARRVITVGNHDVTAPTPNIRPSSGCGPTRDARIKPEIATVGVISNGPPVVGVQAPRSRNMNAAAPGALYTGMSGTSMSSPLAAGACALLFQCRGGGASWADLKQILTDTAGVAGLAPAAPNNTFGYGFMQMATACAAPATNVDVWLRDHASDTGVEPFVGSIAWLSPDIEVLDAAGNPVANPTHHPTNRFNNVIRVTIRNRGTQIARNTEVYLYWADPATSLPFPAAWNSTGFYVNGPGFVTQDNKIVVAQLAAGGNIPLDFAWAPPAPGSNIRGDDHFCLLVRIENEADASGIGTGGWSSITASNNIALRNVHVQESAGGDADLRFYVIGTDDIDGLTVINELLEGRLRIALPVQALPWRDMRIIEKLKGRRLPYGCPGTEDPLARMQLALKREEVELRTDIRGAAGLEVRDGLAIVQAVAKKLELPYLRLEAGTKMPVSVSVARPKFDKERRYVHVAQRSGGRLVGGVSLELRPRRKR